MSGSKPSGNTDSRELLQRVRRIELKTRRRMQGSMAGEYHSAFKGQGMDFDEVREYVPGDEVRAIDWNVTARMQHPFVKIYREERELTVLVAVDLSASGRFGSGPRERREALAEMGAVIAFSAMRNGDKAGLLLFSDRIEGHVPPARGSRHGLRLIRDLLAFEAAGRGTDLNGALAHIRRVQKKRAIVFLLSDFLAPLDPILLRSVAHRHDLIAIRVDDPFEEELPAMGLARVEDLESGKRQWLWTDRQSVRDTWRQRSLDRKRQLKESFRRAKVDQLVMAMDDDPGLVLERFLHARGRR